MTDPIKAKIIEAVPEIRKYGTRCTRCGLAKSYCTCEEPERWYEDRPITLADVLRAIASTKGKPANYAVDEFGRIRVRKDGEVSFSWVAGEEELISWNLTTDYDGQTQEVKEFIGKMLGV